MSPLAVNEIAQRSTFAGLTCLVHNYDGSKQQADVHFHYIHPLQNQTAGIGKRKLFIRWTEVQFPVHNVCILAIILIYFDPGD